MVINNDYNSLFFARQLHANEQEPNQPSDSRFHSQESE